MTATHVSSESRASDCLRRPASEGSIAVQSACRGADVRQMQEALTTAVRDGQRRIADSQAALNSSQAALNTSQEALTTAVRDGQRQIEALTVITPDKCRSSASKKNFLKTIYS